MIANDPEFMGPLEYDGELLTIAHDLGKRFVVLI